MEILHIVTLSLCLFTLTLATAALMPQLKRALVLVRDVTLAAGLVVALSFAGFLIWGRVFDSQLVNWKPTQSADSHSSLEFGELFPDLDDELDPLPLPSIEDEMKENR